MENSKLELVIITGMSGAGKSLAADVFEDIGYYLIDNLPPVLIPSIIDLSSRQDELSKIAVVTDLRGGEMFNEINDTLDKIKERGISPKVLFLDASEAELIRRYRENRRVHPLAAASNISIAEAISIEKNRLEFIKNKADYVVDTTLLSVKQLRSQILDIFLDDQKNSMKIQCLSYGNKYGAAVEADIVFDVRCLPNPFYVEELRNHTGLEDSVKNYVMDSAESKEFLKKVLSLLEFSVPLYAKEGKSRLVIAVGCTGGKHRSVTIAQEIYSFLKSSGYDVAVSHRDIEK